jgi:hypothetical protein
MAATPIEARESAFEPNVGDSARSIALAAVLFLPTLPESHP